MALTIVVLLVSFVILLIAYMYLAIRLENTDEAQLDKILKEAYDANTVVELQTVLSHVKNMKGWQKYMQSEDRKMEILEVIESKINMLQMLDRTVGTKALLDDVGDNAVSS